MIVNIRAWSQEFIAAYVQAGLWATPDYNGDPLDMHYTPDDITGDAMTDISKECIDFIASNWRDLRTLDASQAGHDFLLTRDHHGAGYWDRGLGEKGDRLTKAATAYGDSGFYSHKGRVYVYERFPEGVSPE